MSGIPWSWFVMRATGLVGLALLTVSVVLGILGPRLRPTARLASITAHRAASVTGALALLAHVVLAVLDPWIGLTWTAAILPGTAAWKPWGIALAAAALDLLLMLLLTTATRHRAPRAWRRVHLVAYPLWLLAAGHGLLVGTDGAIMRGMAAISVALALGAVSVRLFVPPVVPRPLGSVRADVSVHANVLVGGSR